MLVDDGSDQPRSFTAYNYADGLDQSALDWTYVYVPYNIIITVHTEYCMYYECI